MSLPFFWPGGGSDVWQIFLSMIGQAVFPVVKRVLVSLGIGFVLYQGIDLLFGQIETQINDKLGALSADIYAIFALGGGVTAINIMISALGVKVFLMSLSGGMGAVWRKPGTWPGGQQV